MYINNRGKVEDTRLEAKDRPSQAHGPRCKCFPKKKKVFKNLFQAILKKKVFKNLFQAIFKKMSSKFFFRRKRSSNFFFSSDLFLRKPKKRSADFPQSFWRFPTNFQQIKNSAVLEPRTGQFSRT